MRARDIMTVDVATVTPETAVKHASQIMLDRRVSGLPVLDDDGALVGIITEGDLMDRFELNARAPASDAAAEENARGYLRRQSWKVGDVMSRPVIGVDEETSIARIAALFEERGIKRVPVLRDGGLVGIVSRADLLRGLATAEWEPPAAGDEEARLATMTRLRDDVGVRDLSVTVKDGILHLWGSVGSDAEREAAQSCAESVGGTRGVENHLRVELPQTDANKRRKAAP